MTTYFTHHRKTGPFLKGLQHGLPIGLGYFSVSIGFGLLAVNGDPAAGGLTIWQAVLISLANFTSAGQLAGVNIMFSSGSLLEMGVSQLFINLRYTLMSVALSQKFSQTVTLPRRLCLACFNTDEIFAVSASEPGELGGAYMAGLVILPYLGWALGTLTGAVAGAILPAAIRDGMGILLYCMFLAVILPPARKSAAIRAAVALAVFLRCVFRYVPHLNQISGGFAVVLCALLASMYCALRYPIQTEGAP